MLIEKSNCRFFTFTLYHFTFAILLLFSGCARSVISIDTKSDETVYPMFGDESNRNFYYPVITGDSLVEKWQADINGSFSNSSVTIHDHFVFVSDLSGRVFCFDINTGKEAGQLKHKGAVFTAPIINNFSVIYAYSKNDENNSELIVYNFSKGEYIAEVDDIPGRLTTEIIKIEDGIIFVTENGIIYKYDFRGNKIFEFQTKEFTHSSPALKNNILVFGNDKGELIGFDIENKKNIYREKISESSLAGVSISGSTAFIGDYFGKLYAVNINSGKKIWNYETGKRIDMTPAYDDENIFVGNLGGELFSLTKSSGKLLWKTSTEGVLQAAPLITDNLIFIPDLNRKLHLINKEDGKIRKSLELEGRAKLSPVYFDNLLFIGYDDGILAAYEIVD